MAGYLNSEPDRELEQARDDANAWIARFAPLVLQDDEVLTEAQLRQRLTTIGTLQARQGDVRSRLANVATNDDYELTSTLDRAVGQLDSIEADVRRRLAQLIPGDPEGLADLDAVNEKLAERLARQEIGAPTTVETPAVLEVKVSPGNFATAAGLGVFGLGWTSFTLLHSVLMIGGMFKAFGWASLLLLGFYAIFYGVGFAMLYGALNAASTESLTLDGNLLTIRRTLGFWVREKQYRLNPKVKATIQAVSAENTQNKFSRGQGPIIALEDTEGRSVQFGQNAAPARKQTLCDQINAYLAVNG